MIRRLIPIVIAVLVAAGCAAEAADPSETYFEDAAVISTLYETSALTHFNEYRTALEAATAETGDRIYVEAHQDLFADLATAFETAVVGLADLTPPATVVTEHEAWVQAARALNDVFQSADDQLASLTEAPAANAVVSGLPLFDVQDAYRAACESVAALSTGEATATIACEPPTNGA